MERHDPDPAPPTADVADVVDVTGFVRAHQAGVWRYLRLLGAAADVADDLLQETFLVFLRRPRAPGATAPLLRTIARGLWIDRQRWLRRRRALERAVAVDELLTVAPADGDQDLWLEALAGCRELLAPRARRALELAYRDGLGRTAIGSELGLAVNSVRNLLASSRAALRTCIEARMKPWQE